MVEFGVIFKDGTTVKFMIKNKDIHMMTEGTGGAWLNLGYPLDIKKKIRDSRNTLPTYFEEFVKSWKQEDIDAVAKMETDEEMANDMIKDFRLAGHEIIISLDDGR